MEVWRAPKICVRMFLSLKDGEKNPPEKKGASVPSSDAIP